MRPYGSGTEIRASRLTGTTGKSKDESGNGNPTSSEDSGEASE